MNIKHLLVACSWTFIPVSMVQAADIMRPHQSQSYQPVPVISSSNNFSWTGFYVGAQIGGFSGEATRSPTQDSVEEDSEGQEFSKIKSPKLSGFIGGIYAGSNVSLNKGLILGIDADVVWSGKKNTKVFDVQDMNILERSSTDVSSISISHSLQEKWAGATRMRVGFAVDRVVPYVSGGVSYVQLQNVFTAKGLARALAQARSASPSGSETKVLDETKILVGYSVGGGVDVAMTDNVIMRAEYRYSDFGKKKFAKDNVDLSYKTNDFRVGVAYKF
ncbi:outer membrane protein [Bartonella sp. 1-1C]|uniref:outer membrane protein n=1 Tax=Bartonella sp. 1-1C TaxID=515256 RepID=UPI0001F4C816|nr:outer membrane protein [Bartonella sp. 1-1C]ATO56855.1 outer membrane immunogenic protein [Bartonella sp. 1-1C]CBI80227.1 Hemin binding protein D [Bartonella sp. 1-1C]